MRITYLNKFVESAVPGLQILIAGKSTLEIS